MKKKTISLFLAFLSVLSILLTGCSSDLRAAQPQYFIGGGAVLMLTDAFAPVKDPGEYAASYKAGNIRVSAQRSERAEGSILADCTIARFAELLIASNPILRRQVKEPETEAASTDTSPETGKETTAATESAAPEYFTVTLQRENGVFFLEHTEHSTAEGADVRILTAMFKTPTAFWLVRYSAPVSAYPDYRAFFLRWAKGSSFYIPEAETETAETAQTGTE